MRTIKRIASSLCLLTAIGTIGLQSADVLAQAAPSLPVQLTASQACHLLVRTGFAPDQAEVNALTGQSAQQAVVELVRKALAAKPLYPAPALWHSRRPFPTSF